MKKKESGGDTKNRIKTTCAAAWQAGRRRGRGACTLKETSREKTPGAGEGQDDFPANPGKLSFCNFDSVSAKAIFK